MNYNDQKNEGEVTTMKLTNAMAWLAAALVVFGAGGCKSTPEKTDTTATKAKAEIHDDFRQDAEPERVTRFADIQSSNGARNDGMLYPVHFTGGHLNSLGRTKVLLMLEDCDSCEPITVHLVNCGDGDLLDQRKAAVELYLKSEAGPNKLTFHPAAPELLRFDKTENGKAGDQASAAPDTAGSLQSMNQSQK
jgi:hypothetical protein